MSSVLFDNSGHMTRLKGPYTPRGGTEENKHMSDSQPDVGSGILRESCVRPVEFYGRRCGVWNLAGDGVGYGISVTETVGSGI